MSLCGCFERTWSGSVLPYQRAPDHGDRDNNHKEDTDDDSLFSDHCGPDHDYDQCAPDDGDGDNNYKEDDSLIHDRHGPDNDYDRCAANYGDRQNDDYL